MKEWSINYSVKFDDGSIREGITSVEADNIQAALDEAERTMAAMEAEHPDISVTSLSTSKEGDRNEKTRSINDISGGVGNQPAVYIVCRDHREVRSDIKKPMIDS